MDGNIEKRLHLLEEYVKQLQSELQKERLKSNNELMRLNDLVKNIQSSQLGEHIAGDGIDVQMDETAYFYKIGTVGNYRYIPAFRISGNT